LKREVGGGSWRGKLEGEVGGGSWRGLFNGLSRFWIPALAGMTEEEGKCEGGKREEGLNIARCKSQKGRRRRDKEKICKGKIER
jgi:hypothetical protein